MRRKLWHGSLVSTWRAYAKLQWVIVLWSLTAVLGRWIQVEAVPLVFWRTFLTAILLSLWVRFTDRSVSLRCENAKALIATGFLIGLHWILFFTSVKLANISVCLAGIATLTFWTALLEPLMTSKRFRLYEAILGLIIIAALYLIFQVQFQHALGLIAALGSAIFAAIFGILNGQFAQGQDHRIVTIYEMMGACLVCFLLLPGRDWLSSATETSPIWPPGSDWFFLLALAGFCTAYAYSAYVHLLRTLSVFAIALWSNLEPVYGILLGVLIFREHEEMSPGFYLGTLVILGCVTVYPWLVAREARMKGKSASP